MLALAMLAPHWLDREIAGYSLNVFGAKEPNVGVHDSRRGYYLVRTDDCDGAFITVTLTRDRNDVAGLGYAVPNFKPRTGDNGSQALFERALPSLSTGKGLVIGASTTDARNRLGRPTKQKSHGPFTDLVYRWTEPKGDHARHEQRYTFKAGRLIEIAFERDASPE